MVLRSKRIWIEFSQPAVALAVFSPSFDGKDSIPVEKP